MRWLKGDQPQLATKYWGKEEALTCMGTMNIDLDSHNSFDPLPQSRDTCCIISGRFLLCHKWRSQAHTVRRSHVCTERPARCTGCFLFTRLFGLSTGQALTSAEIINIASLPNLHKSFKQTSSHCFPPQPRLRFSSWYLIVPRTGCFTLLSLWWLDKHPFAIKSPWSVTVLQSLWSVLG